MGRTSPFSPHQTSCIKDMCTLWDRDRCVFLNLASSNIEIVDLLRNVGKDSKKEIVEDGSVKRNDVPPKNNYTEKSEYNIVLVALGPDKIAVAKIIRESVAGTGLRESWDATNDLPKTIMRRIKKDEAERLKRVFEHVGASIRLE